MPDKSWDNRAEVKRLKIPTENGRTWTRRIQWLQVNDTTIKLKMEVPPVYHEECYPPWIAEQVFQGFKTRSIADILADSKYSIHRIENAKPSRRSTDA